MRVRTFCRYFSMSMFASPMSPEPWGLMYNHNIYQQLQTGFMPGQLVPDTARMTRVEAPFDPALLMAVPAAPSATTEGLEPVQARQKSSKLGTNVYVSRLPKTVTQEALEKLFAPYGTIISCRVVHHSQSRQAKHPRDPVGFVQFMRPRMCVLLYYISASPQIFAPVPLCLCSSADTDFSTIISFHLLAVSYKSSFPHTQQASVYQTALLLFPFSIWPSLF